jgi:hypothetical protein
MSSGRRRSAHARPIVAQTPTGRTCCFKTGSAPDREAVTSQHDHAAISEQAEGAFDIDIDSSHLNEIEPTWARLQAGPSTWMCWTK